VENVERALLQTHTDPKTLIVRLHRVPFIDATGLRTLEDVTWKLEKRGVTVQLCEANARVFGKLQRAGLASTTALHSPGLVETLRGTRTTQH
jgi:SulP family sulfate permease